MRTLHIDLTTAQKAYNIKALYKVQLTQGANDYTYTQARIRRLSHLEAPSNQVADIVLDNSDGTLTSIDFTGYKGVISYGMTDANGVDRYSAAAPLWVIGSQLVSWPGGLALRLSLAGLPNRLREDKASGSFRLQSDDLQTIKDLLTQIGKAILPARANATTYALDDLVIAATTNGYVYKCTTAGTSAASAPTWSSTIGNTVADSAVVWTNQGRELTVYSHCAAHTVTFDSEDSLVDSFAPKESFSIVLNESRKTAMETLLNWTKNSFRAEDDGEIHIFQPTVSGTVYNYEYSLASGEHTFFNKAYRNRLVIPNYIVVSSLDPTQTYSASVADTASSNLLEIREHHKLKLASTAQANAIAGAILEKYQLDAEKGSALVPMNVGQEVYDYVKVTDARENDNRVGNILAIRRTVNPPQWTMEIQFGSGIGGMGTSSTQIGIAMPEVTTGGMGLTEKQRERQQMELWTLGLFDLFNYWAAWASGIEGILGELIRIVSVQGTINQVVQKKLPSNFSTASTTLVDVTGLSQTITTDVALLLIYAVIGFDNTSANVGTRFVIDVDGTNIDSADMESNVVGLGKTITLFSLYQVNAGSHTIKVETLVSAGTVTILAPTSPAQATQLTIMQYLGISSIS